MAREVFREYLQKLKEEVASDASVPVGMVLRKKYANSGGEFGRHVAIKGLLRSVLWTHRHDHGGHEALSEGGHC
jgi:hypothetical protein